MAKSTQNKLLKRLRTWNIPGNPWLVCLPLLLLSAIVSFLLFDLRVSIGGDDSAYLQRAWALLHKGEFPSFQGPLYPMVLAIFMVPVGFKIAFFKLLSGVFLLGHLLLFYLSFKNSRPNWLILAVLLFCALNPFVQYYGSQTYSEAFFMLLQMGFFCFFLTNFTQTAPAARLSSSKNQRKNLISTLRLPATNSPQKLLQAFLPFLLLGLLMVCMGLARSVGYVGFFAVIFFFLAYKKWKMAGLCLLSFALVFLVYKGISGMIWETPGLSFAQQAQMFQRVDPYDQSAGLEDFQGFMQRLWDNSNLYLSKHMLRVLGLRALDASSIWPGFTVIFLAVFALLWLRAWFKDPVLFFTGMYLAGFWGVSFLILQPMWDNDRLIVPVIPLMLFFFLKGISDLVEEWQAKSKTPRMANLLKKLPWGLVVVVLLATTVSLGKRVKEHFPVLKASLKGDTTFGLDANTRNYLDVVRFADKNLPPEARIVVRKPGIAFTATGREFIGHFQTLTLTPNALFEARSMHIIIKTLDQKPDWQYKYQPYLKGLIIGYFPQRDVLRQNVTYQVYEFPPLMKETLQDELKTLGLPYFDNLSSFIDGYGKVLVFDPEVLLQQLKDKRMEYLIVDKLKLDGLNLNTTVYKFLAVLSSAYPGSFEFVYKAGDDFFEEASLYRVNPERLP